MRRTEHKREEKMKEEDKGKKREEIKKKLGFNLFFWILFEVSMNV